MILLILVILFVAPLAVYAKVADCNVVITGEAETVSFLTKTKEGQNVPIDGVLMKPDGRGPFPGMVILHGHGGVFPPRCYGGALRLFVELGYVALVIDSTSAQRPSIWMGEYTSEDQAQDAHKGRSFLATLPYVMPNKIGVIGWSLGGAAVMDAVSSNKMTFIMEKEAPFQAAVTIYPICYKKIKDLEAPLLIFIGDADVRASAAACRNMTVTKKGDVEYQLIVYPGVAHGYDAQWLSYYDEASTQDTYERLKKFFVKYLSYNF
jgi:dienelactone hydrolase